MMPHEPFAESDAARRVEALLRDAAEFESDSEPPIGFETRALASVEAAQSNRRSPRAGMIGLLVGAAAAGTAVMVLASGPPPVTRVMVTPIPQTTVAAAVDPKRPATSRSIRVEGREQQRQPRRLRARRLVSRRALPRRPRRPPAPERLQTATWDVQVVRHEAVGILTPTLQIVPGEEPGSWVLVRGVVDVPLAARTVPEPVNGTACSGNPASATNTGDDTGE